MFSDEEIKESSLMRPGDEIISIREVCLVDKYDKKYLGGESLLPNSGRDLEVPRYLRDGLYEGLEARFAWTEEDGNIASLVSEPGFGSGNSFGKSLDAALNNEMKEADSNFHSTRNSFEGKSFVEPQLVSSSSGSNPNHQPDRSKRSYKVDKTDPRSRYHYVKYVKRHGRIVKLWECGICSREFQHQYTLMRHLPTHTDERNFHCDACAKSFRQLSTLSQHRAIHSAERPYACEVCNKTFNRVSTLISHRKTHSNEKPYKCHICPKGFHQKGNLRNHLFTHTNERPYRCNICMKGFNQQSNLVCHKNKAHQDENSSNNARNRNPPHTATQATPETPSDNRTSQQCEVSSSVGPYIPEPKDWCTTKASWNIPKPEPDIWNEISWGNNGVIVDPINTYHMGVALATRQTPFALLKSDTGTPVLVKVVDTKLPGGKQMLVPATAEDLRIGGKIIMDNEESPEVDVQPDANAVQIRVPVVATVVPKMRPGGRLQLSVEEPHHAYHSALPTEIGEVKIEPCSSTASNSHQLENKQLEGNYESMRSAGRLWSTPASPPLDLISLDLFEPMGCIPLGPQITSVDIDQPPHSDDSDIFIGKFEESIPLSDSD